MRNVPSLALVEREVRRAICTRCPRRPPGSEQWGLTEPRPCEHGCALFQNLPRLSRVAATVDPMVGRRRRVLKHYLGRLAETESAAGPDALRGDNPLRRRGRRLISILDRVAAG